MPYRFTFDLSRVSQPFFQELARIACERNMHRRIGYRARKLVERFHVQDIIGLDVSEAMILVEDLVDLYIRNLSNRESFLKSRKRVLFLPHCARKYMDNRCQARFDSSIPAYQCARCSSDCLINRAVGIGKERGYDVFVLPGGSCIPEILRKNNYEGVVGVACGYELKLGGELVKSGEFAGQGIPLIRNGCVETLFSLETLSDII